MWPLLLVLTINISPLLDWAVAILAWAVNYVWIICGILFASILIQTWAELLQRSAAGGLGGRRGPPTRPR